MFILSFAGGSSLFTFLDSVPVVDDNLPANSSSCNNLKIEFQHSEIQKHQVIGTVNGSDEKLDLTPVSDHIITCKYKINETLNLETVCLIEIRDNFLC